ncbi:MAG: N-acyl homoserine lactonase family protein [Alphaproteobacteria bacterium]|nr:N-acyl homoserine lactonase family protein [Alphaproteobacteria bacterium]
MPAFGAGGSAGFALLAFRCGTIAAEAALFAEGRSGEISVPIPVFLILHRGRRVLFDAGLHPDIAVDESARIGRVAKEFHNTLPPGETAAERLRALDIDPASIDTVVLSHLHYDHVGGIEQIPNARLLVHTDEWAAAHDPEIQATGAYNPKDFDLGHEVALVEGEHDVFGDGRVTVLPTCGHTPGHQSLRLRSATGEETILAADACYFCNTLDDKRLPFYKHNPERQLRSLAFRRARRDAGARIVPGHDPEFWDRLPQAPAAMISGR